jgi:O-acetyl-ADP-ribose deacetylase
MRRAVLNTYIDLLAQADVIHALRESPGSHVAFLGAGASKEAGVPLANEICNDIKARLLKGRKLADIDAWANKELSWNDPRRRYTACLDAYGSAEQRVAYFRRLLSNVRPSFAHHATALLMARGLLFETALTTNFDKLLERAFVEQGVRECQAIRIPEEAEFWGQEPDKCYVFKLHGDYDTLNILNTRPETRSIPPFFLPHASSFLRARGLLVLGLAANEESILDFVKQLLASEDGRVLSGGVRWGVFVGPRRPEHFGTDDEINALQKAIEVGGVSHQVVELLGDMNDRFKDRRPCSFFPVWGSGNLFLELIENSDDKSLADSARLFLDHSMRLHATFRASKLNADAIESHIKKLEDAQRSLGQSMRSDEQPGREALRATSVDGRTEIRLVYGDITSTRMMRADEFLGLRRAVVSPEDTTISAGGGVALRLLNKASPQYVLNELSKLGTIRHGTCAVTSAGNLPVHYIMHAAALQIRPDGSYDIDINRIEETVRHVLSCSESLGVAALWIPLLGAGVADVPSHESFRAILSAIIDSVTILDRRCLSVVVFDESRLAKEQARSIMNEVLGTKFTIANAS